MAKRKFHKRRSHGSRAKRHGYSSRRRRVGATALNFSATGPLVKFGSIALGYFFGDKLLAPVKKMIGDKLDPKIVAVGESGLGYMLALRRGGKKNLLTVVAGGILLGDGVKSLVSSFGIGGIGPYGRVNVVNGPYGNTPVINGRRRLGSYTPNNSLNGYSPSGTLAKVVGSIGNASGSGISNYGSDCMS